MTFKVMATIAAVAMAAGTNWGCSAVPPILQAKNAYGSAGLATQARPAYAATSPIVELPGERAVGADPDANVRLDLIRDSGLHLHGAN